ncbi:MAG: YkgJ family cysteine cluster protein [Candidatus Bathyarchaeota archaeon]|nr:MAG: YkgJ family cysteine cluster protein [Candidatus Bathyarchaeota archaeon]
MLLSAEDIERLEGKSYSKKFFVRFDRAGYAKLRNRLGYCVFYDVKKQRCKVYRERPLGCRLYPIICDDIKGIIVDKICPAGANLNENKIKRKGKKVIKLLEKIDSEAKLR